MRDCQSGFFIARSSLLIAACAFLALPASSQATPAQAPNPATPEQVAVPDISTTQPAAASPAAAAPQPPSGPPNLAKMSTAQIANLAAYNIALANQAIAHYTYKETEHNQNYIDGKLVVDHVTVTENIFINSLPYMRKIMVDGKPLEGKELKAEQKLYDQAVKDRRALDASARAEIEKHALRSTSPNIDRLATFFTLKLDGHQKIAGEDCIILDAMPHEGNTDPDLAQHIRIALEADSGDVLDVNVEFLADDNGFSKGSVLHTRYKIVGANTLPDFQNWDTVVRFKELLGKAITIHRERTFSDYKRFRATVVIKSFSLATDESSSPNASSATPSTVAAAAPAPDADAKPAEKVKLTPEEKAKRKAEEKAKAEADAKAKAEAKAEAKAKAEEDAKAKAEAKAQAAAEEKAQAEAAAKAQAEEKAKAKAQAEAEAQAKADAKAKAKAEADAKAKAEADEKARAKAQQAALLKADADEKARFKAELARSEAEAKAKIKAQTDAINKAQAETHAQMKEQLKQQQQLDAMAKAKAPSTAAATATAAPATAAASVAASAPASANIPKISPEDAASLLITPLSVNYPDIARTTKTEGKVVVEVVVSKEGHVADARVVSGPLVLREAALDAVHAANYQPYVLNGEPTQFQTSVNVVFSLN